MIRSVSHLRAAFHIRKIAPMPPIAVRAGELHAHEMRVFDRFFNQTAGTALSPACLDQRVRRAAE